MSQKVYSPIMTTLKSLGRGALMVLLLPVYIVTAPIWIAAIVMYVRWLDYESPAAQAWRDGAYI